MRKMFVAVAMGATLLSGQALLAADTLIYGYEDVNPSGPDGFFGLGATTSQDTIGATQGTHSLKYDIPAGQTFVGARTETVIPPALGNPPGVEHVLFDLTVTQAYAGAFADIGVTVFGHALNNSPQQFGDQAQFAGFVAIDGKAAGTYHDLQIDLSSATNPVTFATAQTFNQIFGPNVNQLTVASAFQFFVSKSGDAPLTVYIDNVRVGGAVPEPASLGLVSMGAVVFGFVSRRRRS